MNPDHPGFEDLSAHHDGEAPEWAEHVTGCDSCQSHLGELVTLTAAVAQLPSAGLPGRHRDDAVTHAIETAGARSEHGAGGGGRRRWVGVSAAAVLAISIGVGAVVAGMGPHQQMTRDALPGGATAVPGRSDRATAGGIGPAADTVVAGGDLGAIPDRVALVARVGADLRTEGQRGVTAAPDSSAPPPPAASNSQAPAHGVTGTRPCEVEARGDPGDRGEVVYQATAEEAGTQAVVLAFRSALGPGPITVEMRARSDCRLLLQGAIL